MDEANVTTEEAVELLRAGNARYVSGDTDGPNRSLKRRKDTSANGQRPFVAILSCADSRVPVEILFDRGIGDIFSVRNAGNISGINELGSIEYAADHLGVPLIVILGHSQCGAVKSVVDGVKPEGSLIAVAEAIMPALERTDRFRDSYEGVSFVDLVAKENVMVQTERMIESSKILKRAVRKRTCEIRGAFYDIEHGSVTWME